MLHVRCTVHRPTGCLPWRRCATLVELATPLNCGSHTKNKPVVHRLDTRLACLAASESVPVQQLPWARGYPIQFFSSGFGQRLGLSPTFGVESAVVGALNMPFTGPATSDPRYQCNTCATATVITQFQPREDFVSNTKNIGTYTVAGTTDSGTANMHATPRLLSCSAGGCLATGAFY